MPELVKEVEVGAQYPYNSRIIGSYLHFINIHYPDIDIYDMLKKSKMTAYEVEDHGHWFTQEQVDLFHDQLIEKTKDPLISRKAGRFMAKAKASD